MSAFDSISCCATSSSVKAISTQECFLQTVRLYFPRNTTVKFELYNYINIFFSSNKASISGNDIFGGLLDRCQINAFAEVRNFKLDRKFNGIAYLKTIVQFQMGVNYIEVAHHQLLSINVTRDHFKDLISSEPVQLCFCKGDTYDCTYQWPTILVRRGEAFSVRAVTVDQVENPVNGTVMAAVLSNGARLRVYQTRQIVKRVCENFTYNVFSTEPSAILELFPDGPCENVGISSKMLNITFLPCQCPAGLQPTPFSNECKCGCDLSIKPYVSSCQLDQYEIIVVRRSERAWINYIIDKDFGGFQIQVCPYDYCVDEPVNLSISLPLNVDKQCAYNRTGIMCGECEEGLSLVFGSSRCVQCSNNYLALLIAFAVAGVALVVFILMLNLTVAIGTTHGLLLYANIVAANSPVFLPPNTATLGIFVSWINLDLGIETCFYDGMESSAKVLLQLVFPIYIYLLATIIIIVSHYWGWFAGLIGRKNPVATLCTLFLLSYSKLLRTIVVILQFTRLSYPNGSDIILWTFNPNIPQFISSRTPFFLVAIIIIVLGGVYTILLFFGQWSRRIGRKTCSKLFRSDHYNAFMDAYHAPFVFKHRYWIGILLFTRIIHHFLSSILDESIHPLIVSCLMLVLLIIKIWIGEVYKNWLINFFETLFLMNLLLFSVSTYYVSNTNGDQVALANFSVGIAFAAFSGIVLFHAYKYIFKNLRVYVTVISSLKRCLKSFKAKLIRNASTEVALELNSNPSTLHTHLLREPLLDDVGSLSAQDHALHAVPSAASPSPRPVTCTVVRISRCEGSGED